jgi:ankyrin repeat protein
MMLDALALAEDDDQNDVNTDDSVALMVNQANDDGETPLNCAAECGHSDCVKLLLEADGVDVNKANRDGYTPLSLAASCGHSDCVKLLIEADGVDVNKADKYGQTPLTWAAEEETADCRF